MNNISEQLLQAMDIITEYTWEKDAMMDGDFI